MNGKIKVALDIASAEIIAALKARIIELEAELAALRENVWHPVSEDPPDTREYLVITNPHAPIDLGAREYYALLWMGYWYLDNITHWRELPALPERPEAK